MKTDEKNKPPHKMLRIKGILQHNVLKCCIDRRPPWVWHIAKTVKNVYVSKEPALSFFEIILGRHSSNVK